MSRTVDGSKECKDLKVRKSVSYEGNCETVYMYCIEEKLMQLTFLAGTEKQSRNARKMQLAQFSGPLEILYIC